MISSPSKISFKSVPTKISFWFQIVIREKRAIYIYIYFWSFQTLQIFSNYSKGVVTIDEKNDVHGKYEGGIEEHMVLSEDGLTITDVGTAKALNSCAFAHKIRLYATFIITEHSVLFKPENFGRFGPQSDRYCRYLLLICRAPFAEYTGLIYGLRPSGYQTIFTCHK